jgi:hypothetical protein
MDSRNAVLTMEESGPAGRVRAGLVAVAITAVLGIGMAGCARMGPGSAKTPDELLSQLQEDRKDIDQASDTMVKRIDMFNASRKPGEPTLQFSQVFAQDLDPNQRDVLDKLVQEEKDVSYKALLQKIIGDRDQIQDLQAKVMHLEQTLPDQFVVAKRGDRQQDLAMNYLTGQAHLDPVKAKALLKQVDQTDELLAGNQVWFFYDPQRDTFRTYVTQGDAGQTPIAVRRIRQRQLIRERDTLKVERDAVKVERDTAQASAAALDQAKTQLESEIATRQNSVFYHAASTQTLKEQGVLSPVLKRMQDAKGVTYDQSLDLRQATTITLSPQAYGLEAIRSVRLLPSIYQEGRDFSIQTAEDNSSAKVVILDPDVFKGKEVLVAVGG